MAILKRTERSRILILDAADAAFREKGFAATSVEEIAMRAGLTRKTVYNLFASKDDIASQLKARAEATDAVLSQTFCFRVSATAPSIQRRRVACSRAGILITQ